MSCKVSGCIDKNNHVTRGHLCNICNQYGHGTIECDNIELKEELKKDFDIISPENQCTVNYCAFKIFHTFFGHYCEICNVYKINCICEFTHLSCPFCRTYCGIYDWDDVKLFGLNEKCNICLVNIIDTRLPCGHVICQKCISKISE